MEHCWVTDRKEGGNVKGSLLAVQSYLDTYTIKDHAVCSLAGVHTRHVLIEYAWGLADSLKAEVPWQLI
jgi:hypothetical protein